MPSVGRRLCVKLAGAMQSIFSFLTTLPAEAPETDSAEPPRHRLDDPLEFVQPRLPWCVVPDQELARIPQHQLGDLLDFWVVGDGRRPLRPLPRLYLSGRDRVGSQQ